MLTYSMDITVALTMGDPAGIGPEVLLRAAARASGRTSGRVRLVAIAHRGALERASAGLALDLPLADFGSEPDLSALAVHVPPDLASVRTDSFPIGKICAESGRASMRCLEEAIRLAVRGDVDAIVTGPIHKQAISMAGYQVPGHTEFLARRTDSDAIMCMVGGGLIVGFATTHIALREVASAVTPERIIAAAKAVWSYRSAFGAANGPLGILGLNPHASDGGRFGDEESRVIQPAVDTLRASGMDVVGPLVPDVAFREHLAGKYAALIALYHDQGNIVFKALAFDEGVNVTLGLPFLRTSPDHGTAFDIAGAAAASGDSMSAALDLAIELVTQNRPG